MKATEVSDYSVCTVWGEYEGAYYLLDVIRERVPRELNEPPLS